MPWSGGQTGPVTVTVSMSIVGGTGKPSAEGGQSLARGNTRRRRHTGKPRPRRAGTRLIRELKSHSPHTASTVRYFTCMLTGNSMFPPLETKITLPLNVPADRPAGFTVMM
jgi:hypothetical protein